MELHLHEFCNYGRSQKYRHEFPILSLDIKRICRGSSALCMHMVHSIWWILKIILFSSVTLTFFCLFYLCVCVCCRLMTGFQIGVGLEML